LSGKSEGRKGRPSPLEKEAPVFSRVGIRGNRSIVRWMKLCRSVNSVGGRRLKQGRRERRRGLGKENQGSSTALWQKNPLYKKRGKKEVQKKPGDDVVRKSLNNHTERKNIS